MPALQSNDGALEFEGGDRDDWLSLHFHRIFFNHHCGRVSDGLVEQRGRRRLWNELSTQQQDAAAWLGFDPQFWNSINATQPDHFIHDMRLTVGLENYLERDKYLSYIQLASVIVMVWTALSEMRNFLLAFIIIWHHVDCESKREKCKFVLLLLLAVFSYVLVPICVVVGSWLVILESGSILDVIKDMLALLFLLDMNNILQFYKCKESASWVLKTSAGICECVYVCVCMCECVCIYALYSCIAYRS